MLNFIPRSPSQVEWNNNLFRKQPFSSCVTLKDFVEQLKDRDYTPLRCYLRGQILFKNKVTPEDVTSYSSVEFSGIADLEAELKRLQWSSETIHQIYFYEFGYFRF